MCQLHIRKVGKYCATQIGYAKRVVGSGMMAGRRVQERAVSLKMWRKVTLRVGVLMIMRMRQGGGICLDGGE